MIPFITFIPVEEWRRESDSAIAFAAICKALECQPKLLKSQGGAGVPCDEPFGTVGLGHTLMLSKLLKFFRKDGQDPFDDEDFSWLFPPQDLLSPDAWDQYWISQLEHGMGPQFADMFCWDDELVGAMIRANMKTVLCVGSGISQEPRAIAEAGFTVVAMDVSPAAIEIARSVEFTADDVESFFDPKFRRPGGSIDFVVGNFLDPSACPGPFDVIIERRTAQLFAAGDLDGIMSKLSNRLDENGIFFSHCHDACWKPPAEPVHFATSWFRDNGWSEWYGEGGKPAGQVAWTFISTG